ncbi:hypothetical protein AB0G00_24115 [Nocardia salmonicida]|uniref:hypothetical protein n=1 Tax=Nocardia salmonicida TaxID=53431 RepID=UPI0033FDFDB1
MSAPLPAIETVPRPEGHKRENRYSFRLKDGDKVRSVPKLQYMSGEGTAFIEEAIEKSFDEVRLTRALLAIECPAIAGEVASLHADQILWLSKKWAAASAITVGESDGSE